MLQVTGKLLVIQHGVITEKDQTRQAAVLFAEKRVVFQGTVHQWAVAAGKKPESRPSIYGHRDPASPFLLVHQKPVLQERTRNAQIHFPAAEAVSFAKRKPVKRRYNPRLEKILIGAQDTCYMHAVGIADLLVHKLPQSGLSCESAASPCRRKRPENSARV